MTNFSLTTWFNKPTIFLSLFLVFSTGSVANTKSQDQWKHILILNDINGSYGDIGYSEEVKNMLDHAIKNWQIDLVVSPGDLIAGQSKKLKNEQLVDMWDGFNNQILSTLLKNYIPFAASIGNHDGSKYSSISQTATTHFKYGNERAIAKKFWQVHKPKLNYLSDVSFPFFYSFEYANTVFIAIDASGFQMSKQELSQIENLLKGHNPNKTIVVFGHLPLTGIAKNRNKFGEVLQSTSEIMSLFRQYKVDMYISGHQHVYYPAKHNSIYLLNSGGTPPRPLVGQSIIPQSSVTRLSINTNTADFYTTTYNVKTLTIIDESKLPNHLEGYPFDLTKAVINTLN